MLILPKSCSVLNVKVINVLWPTLMTQMLKNSSLTTILTEKSPFFYTLLKEEEWSAIWKPTWVKNLPLNNKPCWCITCPPLVPWDKETKDLLQDPCKDLDIPKMNLNSTNTSNKTTTEEETCSKILEEEEDITKEDPNLITNPKKITKLNNHNLNNHNNNNKPNPLNKVKLVVLKKYLLWRVWNKTWPNSWN